MGPTNMPFITQDCTRFNKLSFIIRHLFDPIDWLSIAIIDFSHHFGRWYHVRSAGQEHVRICCVLDRHAMRAWEAREKRRERGVHVSVIRDRSWELEGLDRDRSMHQIVRSGSRHVGNLIRCSLGFALHPKPLLFSMLPGLPQHRWSLLQSRSWWRYTTFTLNPDRWSRMTYHEFPMFPKLDFQMILTIQTILKWYSTDGCLGEWFANHYPPLDWISKK